MHLVVLLPFRDITGRPFSYNFVNCRTANNQTNRRAENFLRDDK